MPNDDARRRTLDRISQAQTTCDRLLTRSGVTSETKDLARAVRATTEAVALLLTVGPEDGA